MKFFQYMKNKCSTIFISAGRTLFSISLNLSTFNIFPEYKPINCEGNKAWPTVQDLRSDLLLEAILTDLSKDYYTTMIYRNEAEIYSKIPKLKT